MSSYLSMTGSGSDSDHQSDVEAQSEVLPKVPTGFNMPKKCTDEFIKDYGLTPILRLSQPMHEHPHLAFSRNQLERHAMKLVGRGQLIGDVGSAGRIMRNSKFAVHCICPYLQPGDDRRLTESNRTGNTVCKHKLQECTCGPFDVLLFVHSAYYFTIDDFIEALSKTSTKSAFVVGHLFPEAYGGFKYNEGVYQASVVDGKLIYETKVNGNDQTYRHPPLFWDHGGLAGNAQHSLDVDRVSKMGDTYLWRVALVPPQATIARTLDFSEQIVDKDFSGISRVPGWDSTSKMSLAAIGIQTVDVDCIESFGPIVATRTLSGTILFPKKAIEEASAKIMFRERNAATFQDVVHHVRTSFSNARMPPAEMIKAATIAVGLAFSRNVHNETDVLNTVTSRFSARNKLHARLLTMSGIFSIRAWMIVGWVILISLVTLVLVLTVPFVPDEWILLFGLGVGLIVLVPVLCCFCCLHYNRRGAGEAWRSTLFSSGATATVGESGGSFSKVPWFPSLGNLREPLLPAVDVRMDVGVDRNERLHPGQIVNAVGLAGIGIAQAVPGAPPQTQQGEISALTHRVLIPPTIVDNDFVQYAFHPDRSRVTRALAGIKIHTGAKDFDNWVNDPKWTGAQRDNFRKLHAQWVSRPATKYVYKAFIKMEKLKHHDRDGAPTIKPRIIMGPPDHVKVMVGPTSVKYAARLREAWNGVNCRVVYVSGYTPDGLGRLVDSWVKDHGGWDAMMGIGDDGVVYDAHCQNELLDQVRTIKKEAGYSDRVMEWVCGGSGGITRHGVRFERGNKFNNGLLEQIIAINSGDCDTNIDGSLINGCLHDAAIPEDVPCLILVCGDDNHIIVNRDDWSLDLTRSLKERLESAGLEIQQMVSPNRWDWEFCSRLFWEAIDRDGTRCTVFGPKPGRWLHRIGWNTTAAGALNFRGAMVSASQDVAHVPLLNVYVLMALRLTTGVKTRGRNFDLWKHVERAYKPHDANIEILRNRYGLSQDHINEFHAKILRIESLPFVIDYPWIEKMADKDEE